MQRSGPQVPRPCKLPAAYDSASPVFLTSHIPAAIYGGSCGNECLSFVARVRAGVPGGVAQLGERLNGIQEVRGSIPLASTGPAENRMWFERECGVGMKCGNSSVGRAQPCQGWGRGFESRFPLCRGNDHDASQKQGSEMCAVVLMRRTSRGRLAQLVRAPR